MNSPFEIFHLPLGFIHLSAVQVDVFGQEDIVYGKTGRHVLSRFTHRCKIGLQQLVDVIDYVNDIKPLMQKKIKKCCGSFVPHDSKFLHVCC